MIYIIIILFFMFIINYILKNRYNKYYGYSNRYSIDSNRNIIFLDSNSLYKILSNENDDYYKSFFSLDFKTRNIKNITEYLDFIKLSVDNFDDADKKKIEKCINTTNTYFEKINLEWFNGENANKIPWKIGCVKGKLYENGLPHTRYDTIIISKENLKDYTEKKLTDTLIHEKVHLYQRIYKNDTLLYLKQNNFVKFKKRSDNDNIRSNPDLDGWIYKDFENNIYQAKYNENPKSIEDIKYMPTNSQSCEHPYEKMAIFIERYK